LYVYPIYIATKKKKVTEGTTETHNLVYTCYSTNLRFNYDYTDIKIMADTSRTVWFAWHQHAEHDWITHNGSLYKA